MLLLILMFFLPFQMGSCFISWLAPSPTLPSPMQRTERLSCVLGPGNKHPTHTHTDTQMHSFPGPLAASRQEDNSAESWFDGSNPERKTWLFTGKGSSCKCWERRELSGSLSAVIHSSPLPNPSNSSYNECSYNSCALNSPESHFIYLLSFPLIKFQ